MFPRLYRCHLRACSLLSAGCKGDSRLNTVAIVSALLATLTYAGLLTPPRQISNCTDLCNNPTLSNLGETVWYATTAALKANAGDATFINTAQSYFAGLYKPSQIISALSVVEPTTNTFIAFNAVALYLALAALTQTLLLI